MAHFYGWKRQLPDARDLRWQPPAMGALPAALNLRSKHPIPPFDQESIGSCHDDATEVLTDSGFKLFADLDGSERLATVNPQTSDLVFERPTRLVRFRYRGKLICAKNQSLNFRVTPNHRMLVRKWNESQRTLNSRYEFVAAGNLGWYVGLLNRVRWRGEIGNDEYVLSGVPHKRKKYRFSRSVPLGAWVRFLGVYLAEGTMLKRNQHKGRISYKVQIAASKSREKDVVRRTLDEIGVHALELPDRFTFSDKQVYEAMATLGLEGVKAGEKFVPSFVFRLNSEMISEFLSGHFAGDGCEQNGTKSHYTASRQLASDLQTLIFLSGNESRLIVRKSRVSVMSDGREVRGRLPEHRVSVCGRKNMSIERSESLSEEDYDGDVFCAEVPSFHTLVTRRGGKILVSGNCTANASAAVLAFDEAKQSQPATVPSRLFDYYNSRLIEGTTQYDAGATIRDAVKAIIIYGWCPETEWTYNTALFAVKPPRLAYKHARPHRISQYMAVKQSELDIKTALAAGFPVLFGFSVYESFESDAVARTGVVPMPGSSEQVLGGHAHVLFGWDDATMRFQGLNSWGTGWGDGGWDSFPYDFILSPDISSDFWIIKFAP